jgi:hypothetical protein
METDVPHRPGKLYKAKTRLKKEQGKKKLEDKSMRSLVG